MDIASAPDATSVRHPRLRFSGTQLVPLAFLAPALIFMIAMFAYPLFYNVWMSVTDFRVATFLTGVAPFVGLDNYLDLFKNKTFYSALWLTGIFTVISIVGQMTIGMLLALFFWRNFPFNSTMRALLLAPWLLPLVVSSSVWQWMFAQDYGVINYVLLNLGIIDHKIPWLVDPTNALIAVIITNIWIGIPFSMAVFHSGLQALPRELLEAAELDGAGKIQRFFLIILPLLKPLTAIVFVLSVTYTVKVFDLIYVMTGGGPADATQTLAIFSFKLSFKLFDFGHGAAVGNVLVIISLFFAYFYIRSFKRQLQVEAV
jgi:multiple sugar transport system permease protein